MELQCTICDKPLPNRFAIAGQCEEEGCEAVFCRYCWRHSNHRCRAHGYVAKKPPKPKQEKPAATAPVDTLIPPETEAMNESTPSKEKQKVSPERAKKAMRETLELVKRMGRGAADLVKRLTHTKTPQEMIDAMEKQAEENRTLREINTNKVDTLHQQISAKKKAFAKAPPARKRILEMELRALLTEYKTTERTLGILLENERNLSLVKGRLNEVLAYGMSGTDEDLIDTVTDQIEDAAEEAEARVDASRDLERAGKRRERESDTEDLWDALSDFDEGEFDSDATNDNERTTPTATPEGKPEEPRPARSRIAEDES